MQNRWLIILSAALLTMVGFGSRGVFGIIFVQLLREFSWDRASLAGVYSVGMLIMGFGGPLAGLLSRRLGLKRFYFVSGLLVGLTYLLTSRIHSLLQVYLTYGLLGGLSLAALGLGPAQGLAARWFSRRRGLAIGLVAAGAGSYPLFAPAAQALIDRFGWRAALVILGAAFFLIVTFLGTRYMHEPPPEAASPPPGAPDRPPSAPPPEWTLREALRTKPIWLITVAWFFMAITIHFVNTHLVALLVDMGHPALYGSGVLATIGVFSVVNRALGGGISDSLGRVPTFVLGVLSSAAGMVLLLFLTSPENLWGPYVFAVLLGGGTGAQTTMTTALGSDLYRGPHFASIVGFMTIGFGVGGALGSWLGGLIFEITGGYHAMIGGVLAALCLAATCMILAGREIRRIQQTHP